MQFSITKVVVRNSQFMRYFGNGQGRGSYIIDCFGGNIRDSNNVSNLATEGQQYSNSKLDRLFGRVPDVELMRMVRAQKG